MLYFYFVPLVAQIAHACFSWTPNSYAPVAVTQKPADTNPQATVVQSNQKTNVQSNPVTTPGGGSSAEPKKPVVESSLNDKPWPTDDFRFSVWTVGEKDLFKTTFTKAPKQKSKMQAVLTEAHSEKVRPLTFTPAIVGEVVPARKAIVAASSDKIHFVSIESAEQDKTLDFTGPGCPGRTEMMNVLSLAMDPSSGYVGGLAFQVGHKVPRFFFWASPTDTYVHCRRLSNDFANKAEGGSWEKSLVASHHGAMIVETNPGNKQKKISFFIPISKPAWAINPVKEFFMRASVAENSAPAETTVVAEKIGKPLDHPTQIHRHPNTIVNKLFNQADGKFLVVGDLSTAIISSTGALADSKDRVSCDAKKLPRRLVDRAGNIKSGFSINPGPPTMVTDTKGQQWAVSLVRPARQHKKNTYWIVRPFGSTKCSLIPIKIDKNLGYIVGLAAVNEHK